MTFFTPSLYITVVMKKFVLGCRFNFEVYSKNVREKAIKCFLKPAEAILDANGHVLPYT